jgi:hypothetical protein
MSEIQRKASADVVRCRDFKAPVFKAPAFGQSESRARSVQRGFYQLARAATTGGQPSGGPAVAESA